MKKSHCYLKFIALILSLIFAQTSIGQTTDDLQAVFDSKQTTRSSDQIVVDLSNFSALERTRPLYIRNGGNYLIINGTLSRSATLTDSAVVVISGGSKVEIGNGVTISGNNMQTGHELLLLENGTLTLTNGTFNSNNKDYAIHNKGSMYMNGGNLKPSDGIVNDGELYLNDGTVYDIVSSGKILMSGKANTYKFNLKKDAHIDLYSSLSHTIIISIDEELTEYETEGLAIIKGTEKYTLTESDLINVKVENLDTSKWEPSLEDNAIVVRKKDKKVYTDEELRKVLKEAVSSIDTLYIEIGGTIETSGFLYINNNVNIKISGGEIKRKEGVGDSIFIIGDHSTVTFENIELDGNSFNFSNETVYSLFYVDYLSKLVFGKNTIIVNHIVNNGEGHGLITGGQICKGAEVIIDGASFIGNKIFTSPMITTLDDYNININIKSGRIIDNMYMPQIMNHLETLSIKDFEIWGDLCYGRGGRSSIKTNYSTTISNTKLYGVSIFINSNYLRLGQNVLTQYDNITSEFILNVNNSGKSSYILQESQLTEDVIIMHDSTCLNLNLLTDGTVIAAGNNYKLTEEDLAHYKYTSNKWKLELDNENNKIVLRSKSNKVTTQDELQAAIDAAYGLRDTVLIEIDGTINISKQINVNSAHIKITGGTIRRQEGYTGIMFHIGFDFYNRDYNYKYDTSRLIFENITIDGQSTLFKDVENIESPFFISSTQGGIEFWKNAQIVNHIVNSGNGLITETNNSKYSQVIIDGGYVYKNEVVNSPFFTSKNNTLHVYMRDGEITDNYTFDYINALEFKLTGGYIGGNLEMAKIKCKNGYLNGGKLYRTIINNDYSMNIGRDGKITQFASYPVCNRICLKCEPTAPIAYIAQGHSLKEDIEICHNTDSYLSSGIIVVKSYGGYIITQEDLAHYKYNSDKWKLELDTENNQIVLKPKKIESQDDLQDFFDQLGQSEDKGTEKDPIDLAFGEVPIEVDETINIPEGVHVRFIGGNIRQTVATEKILSIPSSSSVNLSGTKINVQQMTSKTLIEVTGKLIIDIECLITVNINVSGGSIINVKPNGELFANGGEISGNTAGDYGVIYVQGNIIINNTNIINNNGGSHGIIYIDGGNFHLNGGNIINNNTINGVIYVDNNSYFYVNGGTISGNRGSGACGGIYISDNSYTYLYGGHFYDNGDNGHYWNGIIYIGPDFKNEDWVIIDIHNMIRLISKLEIKIRIRLRYEFIVSGTIIAQGSENYVLTEDDLAKFICDNDDWTFILRNGNIEAWLKTVVSIDENIDDMQNVTIKEGQIIISNSSTGTSYAVYSLSGNIIASGKTENNETRIMLNEKGVFIIKCGNKQYKIINN